MQTFAKSSAREKEGASVSDTSRSSGLLAFLPNTHSDSKPIVETKSFTSQEMDYFLKSQLNGVVLQLHSEGEGKGKGIWEPIATQT